MSYGNPIDLEIVQQVIDDLEDNNAHTICDMLRSYYGLPGMAPAEGVFDVAYSAAQAVFYEWRCNKYQTNGVN